MREERDLFEKPVSRSAAVSSLGAGLVLPRSLMTAAEWAQALRISLTLLNMQCSSSVPASSQWLAQKR